MRKPHWDEALQKNEWRANHSRYRAWPPKPVVLTESQTAENIDVRIPRGAVITGRVFDEFGDTVPNVEVMTIRRTYSQGQHRLIPIGPRTQTNDIGEYRLFGLEPGHYYV